jgi:1,3-beta-galactosyl-N-acetylhexosamine phosphorylase
MRKPVDRLGYGGYLSLALKFPKFIESLADLCQEFRTFKTKSRGCESWKAPIKVAVLNCWGKWKAWINSFGAPQKFLVKRPDVIQVAGTNLLECLSGLPVEVEFLSFAEVEEHGIPPGIDVIINDGDAETAWSGGRWWANAKVVGQIRRFIHAGGGFIGCRGPSAFQHQGRYFQLADVLGVDREVGHTLQSAPIIASVVPKHFITEDLTAPPDFGTRETFVYISDRSTQLLAANGLHVMVAAKPFGRGRSGFFGALPYDLTNARLLHRAIFWAARKESHLKRWFCENPLTDCAFYPKSGQLVVVNNSDEAQVTCLFDSRGRSRRLRLKPYQSRWLDVQQ